MKLIQLEQYQRGAVTFTALMFVIILVWGITLGGKLAPIYVDNMGVKQAIEGLEKVNPNKIHGPLAVRDRLVKQFRVNNVRSLGVDDVVVIPQRDFYAIDVTYKVSTPLFMNIELVVSFSEQGEVPRP